MTQLKKMPLYLLFSLFIIFNNCKGIQEPIEFTIEIGTYSLTILSKISIIQGAETVYSNNFLINNGHGIDLHLTLGSIPAYPTMKVVVENPAGDRAEWTNINYNPVDIYSANLTVIVGNNLSESYLDYKGVHYAPTYFGF